MNNDKAEGTAPPAFVIIKIVNVLLKDFELILLN